MHMAHTVSVLKTFHEGGSPAFTPPEICCELADLMNVIGKYGWDYAGKDGNKILVRRPYMVSQDGAFIVGITNLAEK